MNLSRNKTTDEAQIRELSETWVKSVRTKNMDRIIANHTSDIVLFDVPPPVRSQRIDESKKSWEHFFARLMVLRQSPDISFADQF